MRQKIIWMLLLLIGAAGSVSCLHSEGGDEFVLSYTYKNATGTSIEMIGYSHADGHFGSAPSFFEDRWMIAAGASANIQIVFGEVFRRQPDLRLCDSIQIVFDQTKALMYRQIPHEGDAIAPENAGTIYDPDRYVRTEMDNRRTHFLYEITEADYESAVDITDASSDENLAELMQ